MKCATIFAALAATAFASQHKFVKRQDAEALQVLATALPQSLLELAITNRAAASSAIRSQFDAGETPSWYSALPESVKTQLVPAAPAQPTPFATPRPSAGNSMPYGTNNTMGGVAGGTGAVGPTAPGFSSSLAPSGSTTGAVSTPTDEAAGGAQESAGGDSGNGAAGLPTGTISVGIAAALGLMGVLAL